MNKTIFMMPFFLLLVHYTSAYEPSPNRALVSRSGLTASGISGITVAGGNGSGSFSNQLSGPRGIFVDFTGNVFIADQNNHRIQKWAPGASSGVTVAGGNGAGSAANQMRYPFDVFVDQRGNIYIDEADFPRVQKWAPGASSGVTVAGGVERGRGPESLADPVSIYLDAAGNLYISDQLNARIQKWAPGASSGVTVAGGNGYGSGPDQLLNPAGVFVDASGNIYVADAGNNRIQKWAPGASMGITVAGGNGFGDADNQMTPDDLFVDPSGSIYVADSRNNRIQKWAPGASEGVSVVAGNGVGSGSDQLNYPVSVFVDRAGFIYVSEYNNNRVQKFPPDRLNFCMPLVFAAPSCNSEVPVNWTEPRDSFPATIHIPGELDLSWGSLVYMGGLNGHGYYKSSNSYQWPLARDIAFYIGDTNVNGHLLTLSSAVENNFIFDKINGSGHSPWIGLYNTGKPNQFAWVTGEPIVYTNWAPNEPNNYLGNASMKEPYVRLMEVYNNWNDQRTDNFPFIAEFDEPLIRYRQISGPLNGSWLPAGIYQVCYEKSDAISGVKDTCCFSITVNCPPAVSNDVAINEAARTAIENSTSSKNGFSITTSPNPSRNLFSLKISTKQSGDAVDIKVTNVLGNVVETRKGIRAGQSLRIGANYKPGIYFAQVAQGNNKVVIRLVKQ